MKEKSYMKMAKVKMKWPNVANSVMAAMAKYAAAAALCRHGIGEMAKCESYRRNG